MTTTTTTTTIIAKRGAWAASLVALACVLLAACDDLVVPAGAQIECGGDDECLDGFLCVGERCVDGQSPCLDGGEALDDGTACARADGPGVCRAGVCALSFCGDAFVDANRGEVCDAGTENGDGVDGCRVNCLPASCGDGVVDTGEQCDVDPAGDCVGCAAHMICAACALACERGAADADGAVDNGCEGAVDELFSGANDESARFTLTPDAIIHFDANTRELRTKRRSDGINGVLTTTDFDVEEIRVAGSFAYLGGLSSRIPLDASGGTVEPVFSSFTSPGEYTVADGVVYAWAVGGAPHSMKRLPADDPNPGDASFDSNAEFVPYTASWLLAANGLLFGVSAENGSIVKIVPSDTFDGTTIGGGPPPADSFDLHVVGEYDRKAAATSTNIYVIPAADDRSLFMFPVDGDNNGDGVTIPLPAPARAVDSDGVHAYVMLVPSPDETWILVADADVLTPFAAQASNGRAHGLVVADGEVLWADLFTIYQVDAR